MHTGERFRSPGFCCGLSHTQLWERECFGGKATVKVISEVPSRPNKLVFQRLRSESLAYSWHLQMDPLCKKPRGGGGREVDLVNLWSPR